VALAKPASVKKKERAEKAAAKKAAKKAEKAEQAPPPAEHAAQASASAGVAGAAGNEGAQPKKKKRAKKKPPARRQPEEGDDAPADEGETNGDVGNKIKAAEARIDDAAAPAAAASKPAERKPRQKRFANTGEPSKTLLFVANLPFEVDDAGLSSIFSSLSIDVKSARIITKPNFRNKSGPPRSKGFGFVEVADEGQQKAAVEKLQGYKMGERELTVKVANTREPIDGAEEGGAVEQTSVQSQA